MDAIVTAGGQPQPGEYLYEETQGGYKAMLDIAGKPMIQWVLDALSGSQSIDRVILIGLTPDTGVTCAKPFVFIPDQGNMLDNIRAGARKTLEFDPSAGHALLVSSDIPGITPEMVDWSVKTSLETDDDFYYTVVPRTIMDRRYPGSKRSFTKLKDVDVCGGDMNMVRVSMATGNDLLWRKIIDARKSIFKQAALIGYDTLFLLVFRLITLDSAVKIASKRLGIKARALVSPYAEIGMDVDKPHQLEMMRADLANRTASRQPAQA